MKGYSPNFEEQPKSELASKIQSSFIELGVKNTKCEEDCNCESGTCKKLNNK